MRRVWFAIVMAAGLTAGLQAQEPKPTELATKPTEAATKPATAPAGMMVQPVIVTEIAMTGAPGILSVIALLLLSLIVVQLAFLRSAVEKKNTPL